MKKNLLVMFGGESPEHEVSIMSARNIIAAINPALYDLKICFVTKAGQWQLVDSVDSRQNGLLAHPEMGTGKLKTEKSSINIDVMFPVLHGQNGEDGTIQGLAKLWHVPCVGPSQLNAAITMNKVLTKRLLRAVDIPVVDDLVWNTHQPQPSYSSGIEKLGKDLFVKPASAGSSVGVTRVTDETQWAGALSEAAKHSEEILIEKAIQAREIELAVIGQIDSEVSSAGEIITGEVFYTYDDKYSSNAKSRAVISADLSENVLGQLQEMALRAYEAVYGCGMARVDFFIDKNSGEIYLNEINSIPGFTDISMYPKLWNHDGIETTELIDRLVSHALEC